MKVMKRFLAMVLTLAMVATLFAGLTLTASAAGYSGTGDFKKCTGALSSGYYVFGTGSATSVNAVKNTVGSSWAEYTATSVSSGTIKNPSTNIVWYYDSSTGKLQSAGSSNYIYWPTTGNTGGVGATGRALTITETGTSGIYNVKVADTPARLFRQNGTSGYRFYTSSTGVADIYFYKLESKTLSSIAISSSNHRSFTTGATFVGETVTATYSDSSTATVNATFSGYNMNTAGTQTVTASYTEGGVTKTATYQITVAAPTPYTLTYSVNGDTSVISGGSVNSGSSVSLPTNVTAPANYTFVGWLPTNYATNDTAPSGLITGTSYTMPAANTTLYAVFAISSGSGSGGYKLVESALSDYSGEYLIVYNNTNALNTHYGNQNANTYGTYTAISSYYSSSDKTIASNATTDALAYTAAKTTNGYSLKSKNNEYLGTTSTSSTGSQLRWDTTFTAKQDEWTLAPGSIVSAKTTTLAIRWNTSSPRFAIYATSNQFAIQLFKKEAGTTYSGYTTTVNTATTYTLTCSATPAAGGSISPNKNSAEEGDSVTITINPATHYHLTSLTVDGSQVTVSGNSYTFTMPGHNVAVAATFTADPTYTVTITQATGGTMTASKTTGIYAGETITLTATPSTHYSFNGWQCTAGGASISGNTFTMPAANVTITGSFTEAAKYTVTYSVNGDTSVVPAKNDYVGTSYTLPTASDIAGYTFAGWVESAIGTETTTAPTVLSGSYAVPSTNKTLYAVYTRTEGGSGSTQFTKVTTAPADWSGDYLLVYEADEDTGYVFSGVDAAYDYVEAEIVDDSIAIDDGMAIIEIAAMTGGYSLKVIGGDNNGKYISGTSDQNKLNFNDEAQLNTIAISDGSAVITSNTSVMRYNNTNSATAHRFRYYKAAGYADQQPIQLYKKGTGTTYYTTTVLPPAVSYTLTYSASPAAGGTIACDVNSNTQVEENELVVLTATAAEHFTFASWTVSGTNNYVADGNEIIVTMTDDVTVTANFTADPTYTVTLNQVTGGTLVANKTADIYAGEAITVTANPAAHYTYENFSFTGLGVGTDYSVDDNVLTFTMPANNVTVSATFTEDAKYTVTFYASSLQADTGSALSTQSIYDGEYATAPTPGSKDGFTFVGWYTAFGTWSTDPGVLTSATVNSTAVTADVTYYGVWAEGGSAASEYTTAPVQTLDAIDDTVIIDWALPVTFNVLTNDNINVTVEVIAGTLPSGVENIGNGSFTYTPSDWQTADLTFTYTLSGTVNGSAASDTATVTLKTADSIYYEDTYSGIFNFTNSTTGHTWTPVTDPNLSNIDDIFAYEKDHFVMYSGGTAKQITVEKGDTVNTSGSVSFSFAGTGFDVISATTNNSGAVLMTIKDADNHDVTDPVTHRNLNAIYDNFRGYTYSEVGYTRYGLVKVTRYDQNEDTYEPSETGGFYYDSETKSFIENNTWYDGEPGKYYDDDNQLAEMIDPAGSYIRKEFTSHWMPYDISGGEEQNYNTDYYQIPVIRVMGLPYGTYNVTLKPFYSSVYDRAGDSSYDFIFDGVRIHNPVENRAAQYKYISIHDAVKAGEGFGSGKIVACDHVGYEWSDWTFCSSARNTASTTTCNRGSFVQYCSYCGGIANTAYFHVAVTADNTELGVGGYNSLPSTTTLRYTLTADTGDNQAAIQAKLDALTGTLTEYWSSNTGAVMTCTNNSSAVIAKGAGTTYATLQLKDPATQTIYASAIHSPMITVYEDTSHQHVWSDWAHDADSDPSTHTHTCTGENCSFYETESCVFTSEVTTQPTQSTPGTKTYTCSGCGYSYEETIPALGGHTATFHVPAGATAPAAQTGSSVTMPAAVAAPAAYDAHSYTFVGWVKSAVAYDDTAPAASDILAAGASVTLNANTDFYALYTYQVGGSGGEAGYYLAESVPTTGDKIIIAFKSGDTYYALPNGNKSSGASIAAETLTVSDGKATATSTNTFELITNSGNMAIKSTEAANYLGFNSDKISMNGWGDTKYAAISAASNGMFTVYSSNNSPRGLSYSGTNFTVANAGGSPVYIFTYTEGGSGEPETYYTTNLAATCKHTNTTTTTVNATCTAAGTTTVTCVNCGEVISVTPIAALGHDYTSSVSGSVTTYTCSRCDDTYTEDSNFAASYILQDGLSVVGGSRSGNVITLPTGISGMNAYDAHTYEFVGWATATSADSTTNPTVYAKGEEVPITADTTFYPVYKFGTAGGTGTWTLLENASTLSSGMKVVFASKEQGKTAGAISDSIMASIASTFSSDKKTITDLGSGTVQMTVGGSSGAWTFSNGSALLGATAVKKVAWGSGTTTWSVSISNGSATIQNGTDSYGRFLYNVQNPRFTTYTSNTSTSMLLPEIYYQSGGSSSTTYTFELEKNTVVDTYAGTVTASPSRIELSTGTATVSSTLKKNGTAMAAADYTVTYAISGSAATLSGTTVTAGANTGSATITATFKVGGTTVDTATCTVTVYDPDVPVTVNYIGSQTGKVYNWGTRGTTATFLTEMADNYYTGSYSYDTLSALSGNSGTGTDFYSSALGTAIHNMLVAKQTNTTTYAGTTSLYAYTDCVESGNKISSYYSATPIGPAWDSGSTWNREHTWPDSKGLNSNDEHDIMMLRPTAKSENSSRGNDAYGEGSGYYDPNREGQNLHGDVARLMLQHLMRWGNTSKFYGTGGVMESRAILLKWLAEDPVDTWEMGRNDAVQRITGVRNVFVDYPELAFKLLGADVPANYTTPSASGIVAAATYSASAGSGYEPVTEAANTPNSSPRATAPASARTSIVTGSFNGAVIIDGKGTTNTFDDFKAYGPNNEVYLAPGQGIVFSLSSDIPIISQDLQIGAKAVNGTAAAIDVASISNGTESTGIKYLLQNKAIASATEMYYELDTTQMGWNGTESSVLVIYNSGSGVLSVTNLRYSTANNNTLTMNINEVQTQKAAKMIQIVYGEPITDPDPIEPTDLDLNFASAELVLNSDIAINFNVEEAVMDSADGIYAVFTKALYNDAGDITGYAEETVYEATFDEETGKYSFRFTGINPAEMGSAVTATLYGYRNGELVEGKTINYSVLTYINNMYGKVNDKDFRALIADLAAYGAAAQNYVSYNTANLVTASVADGLMAYATAEAPELNNCTAISDEGKVKFTGAYLSLREKVTICYMIDAQEFDGNVADLELRIFDGARQIGTATFAEAANGMYVASFSGLNALQMRTVVTAEVYEGDSCVSNTLDYSIESYAAGKAAGNDALAALVNAMMNFGISAENYFAK